MTIDIVTKEDRKETTSCRSSTTDASLFPKCQMSRLDPVIAVAAETTLQTDLAKKLAHELKLSFVDFNSTDFPFLLVVTPKRLELRKMGSQNSRPVFVDFCSIALNHRVKSGGGGAGELIAKAVGIKKGSRPKILDVTAGLGTDAFVLASLGCEVLMLERSVIVAALLKDGLQRLKDDTNDQQINMQLKITEAADYLRKAAEKPDVIYLDPMYPPRKKQALGKKSMRVLHELVGADADVDEVFSLALKCAKKRVVVKRPVYAGCLGETKPDLEFSCGKSSRYDVYFVG